MNALVERAVRYGLREKWTLKIFETLKVHRRHGKERRRIQNFLLEGGRIGGGCFKTNATTWRTNADFVSSRVTDTPPIDVDNNPRTRNTCKRTVPEVGKGL